MFSDDDARDGLMAVVGALIIVALIIEIGALTGGMN
jgi:hypothetical protein